MPTDLTPEQIDSYVQELERTGASEPLQAAEVIRQLQREKQELRRKLNKEIIKGAKLRHRFLCDPDSPCQLFARNNEPRQYGFKKSCWRSGEDTESSAD